MYEDLMSAEGEQVKVRAEAEGEKTATVPTPAPEIAQTAKVMASNRPKFLRQVELIERVAAYDSTVDEALLNRAYVYAMRMHGAQLRASGDPYFAHPIEVAGILTDYRLDA